MPPTESEWFVYILACADDTLYAGVTTDAEARLAKHNDGVGAKYTRTRRPVELVYLEPAGDRSAALKREHAIKRMSADEKRRLIAGAVCDTASESSPTRNDVNALVTPPIKR